MGVIVGDNPLPRIPSHQGRGHFVFRGEDCAKTKDQPRSSKAIQKDRDRKDQSQKGVCTAYLDEEIGQ